jgi:protein PhnA
MTDNNKDYDFDYDQYDNFYDTYSTDKNTNDNSDKKSDTKDCNGADLFDGDSVTVNKDLKIKGMSKTLKRGDLIKNIRTIGDPENVECRIGKSSIVLKTCFLKKA